MNAAGHAAARLSTEDKRARLARLLRERGGTRPLSFGQRRLWFLDRLDPGNPAYNVSLAVRLEGEARPPLLAACLAEIVRRHQALRTVFSMIGERPVQIVTPASAPPLPEVDLGSLAAGIGPGEARRLAAGFARLPFDLGRGPLCRFALLRTDVRELIALASIHHIASDAWSLGILLRELSILYGAYAAGRPSPLAELPIQYADFAQWQQDRLSGEALDEQLGYWRRQLAGAPSLDLPTDRPRPAVRSWLGGGLQVTLPARLSAAVVALGQREGATLFMALLAAFQALLSRWTGQVDVSVGVPIAGRSRREVEGVIGFFVNTLVLRTDFSGAPTFRAVLARVRETALAAYSHQDLPFERLVGELRPERDLSRTPLFQAFFALQNVPAEGLSLAGIGLAPFEVESGAAKFDLSLDLQESPTGIAGVAEYSRDLFDPSTIRRLARHFETFLLAAVERPDLELGELVFLSPAERHQVTAEWTAGEPPLGAAECVHHLVARQAEETPDAVAAVCGDRRISYRALAGRAARLAGGLRRRGAVPGAPVAIALERSLEMLIAMLAVLETGAAYVPIDPGYPRERRAFVLADSMARLVITASRRRTEPVECDGAVAVDPEDGEEPDRFRAAVGATDLAYVIFTSGSTGRPKGVEVEHGGLARFLAAMRVRPGLGPRDRLLAVTSLSFDIAALELFLPLIVGACTEIVPREVAVDGVRLRARLEESQATAMQATPPTWRLLLEAGWRGDRRLRIFCGGEALPPELAHRLAACGGAVWNLYGPTETTIWSTLSACRPGPGDRVTVGRPIPGTWVAVLDRSGRPLPIGVVGELHLGGAGVARGYLGRPELTAERFVPDPAGGPGSRRYRTGDLVRWLADGELECLGRVDSQVKVRGHRVELGEIEAALVEHPAVGEAAVVARREPHGEVRLAAYVAFPPETGIEALRAFLKTRLPDAMVPTYFTRVDALPRLPNGKIDRAALPEPDRLSGSAGSAPPRTERERALAEIWTAVLGVDQVGIDDNFFELGGDSIHALQVVSRAEAAGLRITPRQVFQLPTIGGIAAEAEDLRTPVPAAEARRGDRGEAGRAAEDLVPHFGAPDLRDRIARDRELEALYPPTPVQQGMLLHTLQAPDSGVYVEQVSLTFGALDPEAFERAWRDLVARHDVLRSGFAWRDLESLVAFVPSQAEVPWARLDWRALEAPEQERALVVWLADDRSRGFEIDDPPLLRCALIRLDSARHRFIWTFHHALLDGWSLSLLLSEICLLYDAALAGAPAALPEPGRFRDYAEWLGREDHRSAEAYWRGHLAGLTAPTRLGIDRADRGGAGPRGGDRYRSRAHVLSAAATSSLQRFGRGHGLTLNTLVQGAFSWLLACYSGEPEVLFGAVVSGRSAPVPGIESIVGLFISTLPVRVRSPREAAPVAWLRGLQDEAASRHLFEHAPLLSIHGWSEIPRERALFDAILVFENYPVEPRAWQRTGSALAADHAEFWERTNYPLTLLASPGAQLSLRALFADDRFETAAVLRLLGHLEALLDNLARGTVSSLGALAIIGVAERHQLIHEWSDTRRAGSPSVPSRFAAQVARTPDAVAVVCRDRAMSYRELARRAGLVAARLIERDVGPGSLVGIGGERSIEQLAALLGILGAGAAYLPLDSSYPAGRLAYMVADSGATPLLDLGSGTLRGLGQPTIALERLLADRSSPPPAGDAPEIAPEALAYVIYTSGSTGKPKGVEVAHRGLASFLGAMAERPGLCAGDRLLAASSLSFDIAALELFLPLSVGAGCELVGREIVVDGERLLAALNNSQATAMQATPATWRNLIEAGWQGEGRLKILCGGEALPLELARQLARRGREVWNLYGPTETTIWSTVAPCGDGVSGIDIGRPIDNTTIQVIDREREERPIGLVGELAIGGLGVARGYRGRPDLTAERFVPDPAGEPGARRYLTGDLARRLDDGRLECLGRIDHQVKLRGHRIEVGEIEAALERHPWVASAAVAIAERNDADRRLAAYVVPRADIADGGGAKEESESLVAEWRGVWDETYRGSTPGAAADFDTTGWRSSATGEPIPDVEMQEWLAATVDRILSRRPGRVLEIGCGTGMLLARIAPRCERYVATDFSARAIERLERRVGARPELSSVELSVRPADDFAGFGVGSFDAVLLNSVVQYFPDRTYLERVLEAAAEVLSPAGFLWVGDVRSLPLAGAFHAWTALEQAPAALPSASVASRARYRELHEVELLIAPALFFDLAARLPTLGSVEIVPHRVRAHNELSRFRYNALIHGAQVAEPPVATEWHDARSEGIEIGSLRRRLASEQPDLLAFRGVPNARLDGPTRLLSLFGTEAEGSAGDVRRALAVDAGAGIEPEDLWGIARELPYEVELSWAGGASDGSFDAVLWRRGGPASGRPTLLPVASEPSSAVRHSSVRHTNVPERGRFVRSAADRLIPYLARELPDYMVPLEIHVLEALPLTANGKVDRGRLAVADPFGDAAEPLADTPLATETERRVAAIWSEILGRERIGANDSFFALGGHSLLATRIVSKVRASLGVEIAIRTLFEAPTVRAFAGEIERALRSALPSFGSPPIARRGTGAARLSFAQDRLWLLDRLDPGSPAYNLPVALRASGSLDRALLARSLAEIVRRHESLRTTFRAEDQGAVQVVGPAAPLRQPLVDFIGLPRERREATAVARARGEARRGFDLERGPLLRLVLLRLDPTEHLALFNVHHIVSDGWSQGVLIRELGGLYQAFSSGRPSPFPELELQYADFAEWQRDGLSGETLAAEVAHWRATLLAAPALATLPLDRPRSVLRSLRSFRGGQVPVAVPAAVCDALRALGRAAGTTLFMALLGSFQCLLRRIGGDEDLLIATPIANRNRAELEGLIGFFVNTLVLRGSLAGDPSFRQVLARCRTAALDAFAHQDLPFETLVAELQIERSLTHGPLVQVLLTLQNLPQESLALPGLTLDRVDLGGGDAIFDLALTLTEVDDVLVGDFEFNRELFGPATALRLAERFGFLIAAIAAEPDRPVAELPLLGPVERHALRCEWSDGGASTGAPASIDRWFEEQAARHPDAVALWSADDEDRGLSFGELDARADGFAGHLAALGVGPETVVGVCVPRSPALVVAMLGIFKAGGVYLPLDPTYPRERLLFMLEDVEATVLVRDRPGAVPEWRGASVSIGDAFGGAPRPTDRRRAEPEQLAYLIYTSGSTGRPKGVAVSHAIATSHFAAMIEIFDLKGRDRMLHFASPSFDAALEEVWPALLAGATVVVRGAQLWPPESFSARILEQGLTVLDIPTAYWAEWVRALGDGQATASRSPLRWVAPGGEALAAEDARRWRRTPCHDVDLLNTYGPTEAVITATSGRIDAECLGHAPTAPIGRPLPGRTCFQFDVFGALAPVGSPGELHVGGPLLARGYLGRPELTATRFVPDPFGAPGSRLYRTGDLTRSLANGAIEFLGRIDRQVKVRGVRIELGEVEAALLGHPAVWEAIVDIERAAAMPADLPTRLVAWVVAPGWPRGEGPPAAELRRYLAERLPEQSLPAAFVRLDALPRLPNGKVDRRGLAPPTFVAHRGAVRPRGADEELLAQLFAEVLGNPDVGATDDFFALGGHSLLATRLLSRLHRVFGVDLPLRAIFEAPTIRGLAQRLRDERSAATRKVARPPLEAAPRTAPSRLSFPQLRLWLLDRLTPGRAEYHIPGAVRLRGPLELGAVAAALQGIVDRHEALRTTFAASEPEPIQRIADAVRLALPRFDLAALGGPLRERELRRVLAAEAGRPFDLKDGPLFRFALVALGIEEHALGAVLHHIVSDGWSMEILVRELGARYCALREGRAAPLPPLAVRYADFAAWQRRRFEEAGLEDALEYWRGTLAGLPPALDLPTDRPQTSALSGVGGGRRFAIATAPWSGLRERCRQAGATPFIGLAAAAFGLLARYTGQEDLALGTPIAGRSELATEDLIGFFVNTLVLRGDLSGDPDLSELLTRVRETTLGAFAHQDLPFDKLVEELRPERGIGRTPLFQVAMAYDGAPVPPPTIPGLEVEPLAVATSTAKFALTLFLVHEGESLGGSVEYASDLFDPPTIERLVGHFATLVERWVAEPSLGLGSVDLLAPGERAQLLVEWNDTASAYPRTGCLHEILSRQVEERPDSTAVEDGERAVSYREVERRAARLAGLLAERGASPGARVGICLERSIELIVGWLAILKTGAAYVPLDPSHPAERLAFMLEDCGARLLIGRGRSLGELRHVVPSSVDLVDLDAGAARSATAVGVAPDALDLALIIYTSGSTGRPKGIAVPHRAVVRLVREVDYLQLAPLDRVAQASNASFDAASFEVWGALLNGSTLAIVAREAVLSPRSLVAAIRDRALTAMFLTTALFNQVVSEIPDAFAGLSNLLFGGEAVDPLWVRRCLETGGPSRLLHVYGPSENATFSTWHEVRRVAADANTVPIGRPIANSRSYLLDPRRRPVPIGVVGELYVAGDGLARGYVENPELTRERFVPTPFGGDEMLYRTGDLARLLADGNLVFAGRIDHQVKLRGFRVEPAEVEAALTASSGIRQAAVVLRSDLPGGSALVAYVVAADLAPSAEELRATLCLRLPDFMVPAHFVYLDDLPLNPNGKVDRAALPAPQGAPTQSFQAPRTPREELLAGILAELLDLEQVGIDADFFALGGHSLLAARFASRLERALNVEVPVRAIFEAPRVRDLARWLDDPAEARSGGRSAVERGHRAGPLPLSFAQERIWFLDQLAPGNAAFNIPLGLRVEGPLEVAALEAAVAALIRRHESLRTRFPSVDGIPEQVVDRSAARIVSRVDLRSLPPSGREGAAAELARRAANRPIDLARGPMLRVLVIAVDSEVHDLILILHHIVADGWSVELLARELSQLYAAGRARMPSPLPELPIQFADYAIWQRRWLSGERLAALRARSRARFDGSPPILDLPTDRPRPAVQSFAGATISFALPERLSREVLRLARRAAATPFMILAAAFEALLGRLSGQERFALGTPIAGRGGPETEALIGCFFNSVVLVADLAAARTASDLIARVRADALAAFGDSDLPFEVLVEELQPERDLSRSPVFQALISFQNLPSTPWSFPDLRCRSQAIDDGAVQLDLVLALAERESGLHGSLSYSRELFDPVTCRRWLGTFERILGLWVETEERFDSAWWSASEAHQAQREWNDTDRPSRSLAVTDLLRSRVGEQPDAVAVSRDGEHLSFGELARRSGRLADALIAADVQPEQRVGIFLSRTFLLPIAVIAVLETGAVYVPLDPSYPKERLRFMVRDADMVLLLTETGLAGPLDGIRALDLDRDFDPPALVAERPVVAADQLAYTIYTSGSSGRPKGVGITHRALVNFLLSMSERPGLRRDDVLLAVTSLSFDIAGLEIFLPLLVGARIELVSRDVAIDGAQLRDRLERSAATVMQATPSAWSLLVEAGWRGSPGLRALCGGEALAPALAAAILERTAELWNLYGPTETTIWSTLERIDDASTVSIGRPIANTTVRLVDREMRPATTGVVGELVIGGTGVARGYFGRPELTAERFIPDLFSESPGDRCYRTGDLARHRADGGLELLGRIDSQVKVRGHRIELGEIEANLMSHPRVVEAAVLLRREPGTENPSLIAFHAPREADAVATEELRAFLRDRLPSFMVPAAFIAMPALPRLGNGKLDRGALKQVGPDLDAIRRHPFRAPQTTLERRLAEIWEKLLGIAPVGVLDDFFDIGGHSLLAVRLLAALRRALAREIPLAALFANPTIEGLARYLLTGGAPRPRTALLALQPEGERPPFFCVHPIGGGVMGYRDLARHLGSDQPFFALQAPGLDDPSAEEARSIEEMASAYLDEVVELRPRGPYLLGGFSFGGLIAFEMARQLRRRGEEVPALILFDTPAPVNRAESPATERDLPAIAAELARQEARQLNLDLSLARDDLQDLDEESGLGGVLAAMREAGMVGSEIDTVWLRGFLRAYLNRVSAAERYRADDYGGDLILIRPRDHDPDARGAAIDGAGNGFGDSMLGWNEIVVGGAIEVVEVPGFHETMTIEPNVRDVGSSVRARLDRALETAARSGPPVAKHGGSR